MLDRKVQSQELTPASPRCAQMVPDPLVGPLLRGCARTAQVSIGEQPQGYTYEDGSSVQTTEATSP